MQELGNKSDANIDIFPYVPIGILVMLFASAYFTYIRAYHSEAVRYFFEESEVETFDPMSVLYGKG